MSYNRFLLKVVFFVFVSILISCGTEKHNDMGLNENELAYFLANGTSNTFSAKSSLSKDGDRYKLGIQASHGSEGIIITVSNVEINKSKEYFFFKDVSVIVNDKEGESLNVYVSSGCNENKGVFEIVNWNENDKTISGKFHGPICSRGIFAHLPGTNIDDAAFFKIKYSEQY